MSHKCANNSRDFMLPHAAECCHHLVCSTNSAIAVDSLLSDRPDDRTWAEVARIIYALWFQSERVVRVFRQSRFYGLDHGFATTADVGAAN